jgi:hypothetical protein
MIIITFMIIFKIIVIGIIRLVFTHFYYYHCYVMIFVFIMINIIT